MKARAARVWFTTKTSNAQVYVLLSWRDNSDVAAGSPLDALRLSEVGMGY